MELFYLFIFVDNPVFVFFVCGFSVYSFTMVLSGKLIKFRLTVPKSDISSSAILPWTEESQDQGHSKTQPTPRSLCFFSFKGRNTALISLLSPVCWFQQHRIRNEPLCFPRISINEYSCSYMQTKLSYTYALSVSKSLPLLTGEGVTAVQSTAKLYYNTLKNTGANLKCRTGQVWIYNNPSWSWVTSLKLPSSKLKENQCHL